MKIRYVASFYSDGQNTLTYISKPARAGLAYDKLEAKQTPPVLFTFSNIAFTTLEGVKLISPKTRRTRQEGEIV